MNLTIISYHDLINQNEKALTKLKVALLEQGIVGVSDVPEFENKSEVYIQTARNFCALAEPIKQKYAPDRDAGKTEGYELGAEKFKDQNGQWQIDDKKASYYAFVPDNSKNIWPQEIDLKSNYLALGELIFNTGRILLKTIGLNEIIGINLDKIIGYGRLLHYFKEDEKTNINPNWGGAHFDHGLFTGLMPAYYFQNGKEVDEPEEAGLYIIPTGKQEFEKVKVDKSILLFQVGEFGQIASNDKIKATQHIVKKAHQDIERFTFALFFDADFQTVLHSSSILTKDSRYKDNQLTNGSIQYEKWSNASYERYRAK